MKKIYITFSTLFILLGINVFSQSTSICNPNGNIIIYSNYDGGAITINVDQNIPNLKIGIVSYEFSRITITGTYAGNVTAVRWAGYNAANNHCSIGNPMYTTISGVPSNVDTIISIPAADYSNVNGYNFIICNYSCDDSTNQGGCNTPDQIVAYFQSAFGETTGSLYYHFTQYGCWSGTYNVSSGGNCCFAPISTFISENNSVKNELTVSPNPSTGNFHVEMPNGISVGQLRIYNVLGEEVRTMQIVNSAEVSLQGETPGIYFLKFDSEGKTFSEKIILTQ